jgi:hypothetical protein
VTFTAKVRPRYLEHELAVIESLGDRSVTVRLWRPVGRFGDGTVRCPPSRCASCRPRPKGVSSAHSASLVRGAESRVPISKEIWASERWARRCDRPVGDAWSANAIVQLGPNCAEAASGPRRQFRPR